MLPDWELWGDWHGTTARSTTYRELDDPPPPPGDDEPRICEVHRKALPVYERLLAHTVPADETPRSPT